MGSIEEREMAGDPVLARVIDRPECKSIIMESINEELMADSILNLNIRGLKSNLGNLEEFMGQIENRSRIKAITLTEIFNADHTEKNNYLDSHTLVSACRISNKHRGGTGIMIHD